MNVEAVVFKGFFVRINRIIAFVIPELKTLTAIGLNAGKHYISG